MQSVVTICVVKLIDIQTLHEKMMGWISVLAQAYQMRIEFEMMMSHEKTKQNNRG
jgi:hypothetical protein